jgi:hypothetical protein
LPYQVKGTDTSGTVTLRRDSAEAALKKANELIQDGSWDVEILAPDGHVYEASAFAAMQAEMSVKSD